MALMQKTKRDAATSATSAAPERSKTSAPAADDLVQPEKKKKSWFKRREEIKQLNGKFDSYPHLVALKPKEKIVFRSDYYEVDSSVACVLAFFHDEAAQDGFGPFWGVDRIPGPNSGLDREVTVVVLEQVTRMSEKWVDSYTKQSEKLDRLKNNEQEESGTTTSRRRAAKTSGDFQVVVDELTNGASYLNVHNRLLVKAPTLEMLEDSIEKISRLYIDRFGTLKVAPYAGEQRQELSGFTKTNEKKRGKGFGFTSDELAGAYSLVTNGLNDPGGEYVGYLVGDVNTSAVLLDANAYKHHVVIADSAQNSFLNDERVSNMWCSKLSQAAMQDNGSVVHLVLDGANLDNLGPKFSRLTSRVDLNRGDVNMFEMFGDREDELTIFAAQMEKIKLMIEQLYEQTDGAVASIIRSALDDVLTKFYVDAEMWYHNAQNNRGKLRIVGIPHEDVPRLKLFASYVDTQYKSLLASSKNDPDQLRAMNVLRGITKTMLNTHGDLFNNYTATAIDGVRDSKRVVYDLSSLRMRGGGAAGDGVAMAQLVNIVGFAVGKLGRGDSVIIHGAEHIDDAVKKYITSQFEHLWSRGGRVVYSYNKIDKMLADSAFNNFHEADYTIFGTMNEVNVAEYQRKLHQQIPPDLSSFITSKSEKYSYLRRGVSNVVFHMDMPLGVNPARDQQRREAEMLLKQEEAKAATEALMEHKPVPGARVTGAGQSDQSPADRRVQKTLERKAMKKNNAVARSGKTMKKNNQEGRVGR